MFDVVDTDADGLMNIDEFRTFIHSVTNVKSIVEQWKDIASQLSAAELASLPENTTLMAGKTVYGSYFDQPPMHLRPTPVHRDEHERNQGEGLNLSANRVSPVAVVWQS
jgi:hypothetical protein